MSLTLRALHLVTLAVALAFPAAAQEETPEPRVNYAYLMDLGFGTLDVEGRSVQVVRIPFSYRLRSLEDDRLGVKLTLPVSFGVHDFKVRSLLGREVTETVETVSVVPGVEFALALPRGLVLKPFAEIGAGKGGGETALIYSAGVKLLAERPVKGSVLSLGGALDWAGSSTTGGETIDGFATLELGLDLRRPLGPSWRGRELDGSVFAVVRRFLSEVEFERFQARPVRIEEQYEVGLTVGTEPRWKLWGMRMPRIGVSYRFGDGLEAYRLNFGFPF